MGDITLLAKNEELKTLLQTIRIYSWHIGIGFIIERSAMLIRKSVKRQITEGIELPNQERIRTLGEKENYKYWGILEVDTITTREDEKKKIKKKDCRRTRKFLETKRSKKTHQRNLTAGQSLC